ncbi:MAG: Crp/Fnr family transcriptional regulator [Bacteroides sp.]|nr:Crp/Fnr family transcriptional regulator [Bacteroides sp.]
MEEFLKRADNTTDLTREDKELLLSEVEEILLQKGDILIREGRTDRSLYLISEGILRGYKELEDREVTIWFAVPGEALFSSWGYVEDRPSRIHIVASSECRVYRLRKESVNKLMEHSAMLSIWITRLFEQLLLHTDNALIDIFSSDATERYLAFTRKMPDLLQKVTLREIAGYLGVTPQSLSRIRAQIVKKREAD